MLICSNSSDKYCLSKMLFWYPVISLTRLWITWLFANVPTAVSFYCYLLFRSSVAPVTNFWPCPSFIYRLCYLTNNIFQTHLSADFLWIKIPLLDPQFYLFRLFEWYNVFSGTLLRTPRKPEWEALMVLNHHKKLKSCLISDFQTFAHECSRWQQIHVK